MQLHKHSFIVIATLCLYQTGSSSNADREQSFCAQTMCLYSNLYYCNCLQHAPSHCHLQASQSKRVQVYQMPWCSQYLLWVRHFHKLSSPQIYKASREHSLVSMYRGKRLSMSPASYPVPTEQIEVAREQWMNVERLILDPQREVIFRQLSCDMENEALQIDVFKTSRSTVTCLVTTLFRYTKAGWG